MSRGIVFAGPSLHGVPCTRLDGIDLRPPAAKGDILAVIAEAPPAIGIIDGTFENGASIWHKEILAALEAGIPVLGAASMGALRAAECAPFGMIGIGSIYRDYAEGRRSSDADVAIAHAPADLGYRPLTEALVDIEATLEQLAALGLLAPDRATMLRAAATRLHFKIRRWPDILTAASVEPLEAAPLSALIAIHRLSRKTEDALALIDAIRALPEMPYRESLLPTPLNRTFFLNDLERDVAGRRAS
jgi:hypothetical protein